MLSAIIISSLELPQESGLTEVCRYNGRDSGVRVSTSECELQLNRQSLTGRVWASGVISIFGYPWLTNEKGSTGQKDIWPTADCHLMQEM